MTVPFALRPLYLEELRRLTADLNRTSERIERLLRCLRDMDEARGRSEPEVAASARLGRLPNVVPLFPQVGLHRPQPSDGAMPHAYEKTCERER